MYTGELYHTMNNNYQISIQWLEKQVELHNHYDHIKGSIRDSKIYLKF